MNGDDAIGLQGSVDRTIGWPGCVSVVAPGKSDGCSPTVLMTERGSIGGVVVGGAVVVVVDVSDVEVIVHIVGPGIVELDEPCPLRGAVEVRTEVAHPTTSTAPAMMSTIDRARSLFMHRIVLRGATSESSNPPTPVVAGGFRSKNLRSLDFRLQFHGKTGILTTL
ncbi:MAG: hypothetical protein JST73_01880 [Actinobacteria bacterium]|nr:hypothetical protein [Actinomycetota bacterium]